ncbi:sensor histidine kinase [Nocardia jinanensis]|uniref:histidine kinase n=1 Tax=Nocardia jinanensis TaxID=382504 RepID=A0A917VVW7_9NOCA|nr:ATP-binding protein [Nocardia jinanensis]GGL19835.1 hypothetical protein GCM10011588_38210 [Nocardia jinanensis]
MSRVLANLVSNAIAHTPPGGEVVITAGQSGQQVRTRVDDSGPRTTATYLSHLLEATYRSTAARPPVADNSVLTGRGMGPAIAAGLMQAHRGAITATDRGAGCRFEIRLPADSG